MREVRLKAVKASYRGAATSSGYERTWQVWRFGRWQWKLVVWRSR